MKIQKEVLRNIKPQGNFNAARLINNTESMNKRMESIIRRNEKKIALGVKRAQLIQTK